MGRGGGWERAAIEHCMPDHFPNGAGSTVRPQGPPAMLQNWRFLFPSGASIFMWGQVVATHQCATYVHSRGDRQPERFSGDASRDV